VVKQNSDSSWRLILRHAASFLPTTQAAPAPGKTPPGKTPPGKTPAGNKPNAAKGPPAKPPTAPKPGTAKPAATKAPGAKPANAKAAKPAAPAANENAQPDPAVLASLAEQVTFAYCDFSPDGSIAPNPTLGYQFEVRQLLPKLPKNEKELENGWAELDRSTQVGFRYRVEDQPNEDDDEPEWKIAATRQSPVDDIYLCRTQATFFFDGDRGLVERIETKLEQSYGVNVTAVASTRLLGVEQFDDAWCQKLDEEMRHYFAVQERYESLLKEAQRNSADAEQLLVEADVLLQKAAADITLPVVKEDLGKQVARHGAVISLAARAARDRADYIDQPAPTWQGKDLDGKLHSLANYKGKVVVLHFWRRADGWSLRVLPQVEQLAEKFSDQPVVVLGMNTDENEEDASFVANKMGLAFPIVRADKFAEKYNATGSVVFVIDQKGVVRDLVIGYSPTLRDDVAAVVEGLLKDGEE
ncbi:MAG TPA: TlpA disulfide reductase family protein, partial [Pirellulales bacterium]|nr:TlpA disulfide reductase family protein [Pirellulales bacterium]